MIVDKLNVCRARNSSTVCSDIACVIMRRTSSIILSKNLPKFENFVIAFKYALISCTPYSSVVNLAEKVLPLLIEPVTVPIVQFLAQTSITFKLPLFHGNSRYVPGPRYDIAQSVPTHAISLAKYPI